MDFSSSFRPIKDFEDFMRKMKSVGYAKIMLPLFFIPMPAFAANRGAPMGFEELPTVYGTGFP